METGCGDGVVKIDVINENEINVGAYTLTSNQVSSALGAYPIDVVVESPAAHGTYTGRVTFHAAD
jgi:hypothetical protein